MCFNYVSSCLFIVTPQPHTLFLFVFSGARTHALNFKGSVPRAAEKQKRDVWVVAWFYKQATRNRVWKNSSAATAAREARFKKRHLPYDSDSRGAGG
jgi:hypothetical protein